MKVLLFLLVTMIPVFYSQDTEGMPTLPLKTLCNAQYTRCVHHGSDASGCETNRGSCNIYVQDYIQKAWTDCRKINTTEICDKVVRAEYNVLEDIIKVDGNLGLTTPIVV